MELTLTGPTDGTVACDSDTNTHFGVQDQPSTSSPVQDDYDYTDVLWL